MATAAIGEHPKGMRLLRTALGNRKTAIMLIFGFAAGLPYTLLIWTLNAWLGEWEIDLATIGVLSWLGLAYAFKFLWSPLVDRVRLPGLEKLGRRRSWLLLCQVLLTLTFFGLYMFDPRLSSAEHSRFSSPNACPGRRSTPSWACSWLSRSLPP